MSDLPKIERFQLTEKIGSGGIASVYQAVDPDQRAIALKLLSSTEIVDVERFKKEFLLLNQINHPDIVKAFDFGFTDKGIAFFSMEFIEGKDFRCHFDELNYPEFYRLLIRTLGVLEFLHTKSIIHGDIKPTNILISSDEDGSPIVKFTDFGFAEYGKSVEQQFWKGTIPYLAPEIIRGEQYNHQIDLYSLGVMLYEVLTGKLPFEESDVMGIAKGHLEKEPEFPDDSKAPEFLKRLTLKLLKKDPLDRYYSAREVIKDIERASGVKEKQAELTLSKSLIASSSLANREEELSLLKYLFEEAKCGRTEIILLKSEQGIGKTRLLREFKSFVQTNGATVICKSIKESGEAPLSELKNISSHSYPGVFIFDDFQKIDLEILNSLVILINQAKMDKVIICLALDNNQTLSEEDGKSQQVEQILESDLNIALTKVVLKPLDQKETSEMINSMFRWKVDKERINQAIYKKTAGSPLLITGLMSSLLEQGYIRKAGSNWELDPACLGTLNGPESYIKEIRERLGRLSSDSLSLIRIAAVLGQEFESDILSEVSGFDENDTANYLTLISMENLVQKASSSDKTCSFVNGMVRDLIYNEIDKGKRKALHYKCGEVLERRYSSNPEPVVNTLAYHFVQAENRALAFKYSLLAGLKLGKANNHTEAIKHYENALEFYEERSKEPIASKDEILGRAWQTTRNFWKP